MKIIAYKNSIGGIAILATSPFTRRQVVVTPVSFERVVTKETETSAKRYDCEVIPAETRDETDDELVTRVALKDVPAGIDFKIAENPLPMTDEDLLDWFENEAGAVVGQGMGHAPGANSVPEAPYEPSAWDAAEQRRLADNAAALASAHDAFLNDLTLANIAEHEAWEKRRQAASVAALASLAEAIDLAIAQSETAQAEEQGTAQPPAPEK